MCCKLVKWITVFMTVKIKIKSWSISEPTTNYCRGNPNTRQYYLYFNIRFHSNHAFDQWSISNFLMFPVKVDECDYVFIFIWTVICSYQEQIMDDHSNSNSLQWLRIINFQFGRFSYFFPQRGQDMSVSPLLILLVFKSIHFIVSLTRLALFQWLLLLL
jgi:hypothetical protein